MFSLTLSQFMLLGLLSLIVWILSDFLATSIINKINEAKKKVK